MQQLAVHVAEGLVAQSEELGARWIAQTHAVVPRTSGTVVAADPERNARLCRAVAASLRGEARAKDDVMRIAWELGEAAYAMGSSLHDLLKELGVLESILLHAAQRVAAATPLATAAEGIGVARRIARSGSLLVRSASKSFVHAYTTALQQRYRTLRHDLRNPLGTIRGVVSLMEDPSVPAEMRNDPRFRSMVARNASTLDALIGDQLSDAASLAPAFVGHEVSLREVALAVRRELDEEASEVGCEVEITGDLPIVNADSTSFELALRSLLGSALGTAAPGSTVHVALRQLRDRAATIEVAVDALRSEIEVAESDGLDFVRELSARTGGKVWQRDKSVCLEVPVSPAAEPRHDRARAD